MADTPPPSGTESLTVPCRFRGPARSGNGGWTAGALAQRIGSTAGATVEVTLRMPPPLDTTMTVEQETADGGLRARLLLGPETVAEAVTVRRHLAAVEPVGPEPAAVAMQGYAGLRTHPFPGCFACGPDRLEGDGLRIFPGAVPSREDTVASTWRPHPSLAESGDVVDSGQERVGVATTWAALDCVGGWSEDLEGRPAVLGRMTARVDALPVVGELHVVVGERRGTDGRKTFTTSTLYDSDDRVVATAEHVWIAVDPSVFE